MGAPSFSRFVREGGDFDFLVLFPLPKTNLETWGLEAVKKLGDGDSIMLLRK